MITGKLPPLSWLRERVKGIAGWDYRDRSRLGLRSVSRQRSTRVRISSRQLAGVEKIRTIRVQRVISALSRSGSVVDYRCVWCLHGSR